MPVEQATNPSLDEFKQCCRAAFAFLSSYGFQEEVTPSDSIRGQFETRFEKSGWKVKVQGISYGFAASIIVQSSDGRSANLGYLVPDDFWRTQREAFVRGQLGEIAYCALCLRTFGQEILRRDEVAFDGLFKKQVACFATNCAGEKRKAAEKKLEHVVVDAGRLFRLGRYAAAAALLSPFEGFLPPAQAKKLTIARKRAKL